MAIYGIPTQEHSNMASLEDEAVSGGHTFSDTDGCTRWKVLLEHKQTNIA